MLSETHRPLDRVQGAESAGTRVLVADRAARLYKREAFGAGPNPGPFEDLAAIYPEYSHGVALIANVGRYGGITRTLSDEASLTEVNSAFPEIKDAAARRFLGDAMFYRWYKQVEEQHPDPTDLGPFPDFQGVEASDLIADLSDDLRLVEAYAGVKREGIQLEHIIDAVLFWKKEIDTPQKT